MTVHVPRRAFILQEQQRPAANGSALPTLETLEEKQLQNFDVWRLWAFLHVGARQVKLSRPLSLAVADTAAEHLNTTGMAQSKCPSQAGASMPQSGSET